MAKSRNNLLGVGGQRRKLSRADQRGNGPVGSADRQASADQKAELLRKMRSRATGDESAAASESTEPQQAEDGAAQQDG
ncbi:DUF6243 family protein [Streptomyces sp. NPDC047315]|uniref:DUF6243 family protein n=1 Tax=Streptomyces sp. NPDC047315 TaxID=3155142 RepID=UPI0033DD94F9